MELVEVTFQFFFQLFSFWFSGVEIISFRSYKSDTIIDKRGLNVQFFLRKKDEYLFSCHSITHVFKHANQLVDVGTTDIKMLKRKFEEKYFSAQK